ncbi:MAG: TolC family outer membrane protein [Pseudohongiellaceae bacterium]
MGRFTRLTSLMMLGLLVAKPVLADDLLSILELAMRNDPQLRQAEAQFNSAQQQVIQARSSLLPGASANFSESREASGPAGLVSLTPSDASRRYGVNLQQSLLNLSAWYDYQGAKASDQAQLLNFQAQEQELILRVASAYFEVLRAIDFLETRQQEEEAAERQYEQTSQREEVGLVAITEVYEAQAAYDLARNNTILAENARDSAYEALEAITGQPHPNLEVLSEDFPIEPVEGAMEQWTQEALNNNLTLLAAESGVEARQQVARARRSDHLPTVSLQGGYNRSESDSTVSSDGGVRSGGAFEGTSIAVNVSIPLYSGHAVSARRQAAEYDVVAQQEQLNLVRRQTRQEIRNAYRRVNTDAMVVEQRQQAIRSARSALEAIEAGYEVGTRNIVDVVQARQQLFRALRDHAEARYNYVLDTLTLQQITGMLTPQDIIDINAWLDEEAASAADGADTTP